jgi:hypothetical protein
VGENKRRCAALTVAEEALHLSKVRPRVPRKRFEQGDLRREREPRRVLQRGASGEEKVDSV